MNKHNHKDKHGNKIEAGMTLRHVDGELEYVHETVEGDLGFNASNENHISFNELERKLYPLFQFDLAEWEIVEKEENQ